MKRNSKLGGFKLGFSIAEAMITLLIVSVALAAMAPIMTKKAQNNIGGNSKWVFTRNGSDISRVAGRVGIGVSPSSNPTSRLEIRNDTSDNAVRIYRGSTMVAQIGADGDIYINDTRATGNDSIVTAQNGVWRNALNRTGGVAVNVSAANQRAITVYNNNSLTGWVNGDGSSSFGSPQGMISFFDRPCTSVVGGWANVPAEWQGRYPRIVGNYRICNNDGSCSDASVAYNQQYDDATRNIGGGFGRACGGHECQLFGEPIRTEGAFDRSTTTTYPGADFSNWTNKEMTEWVSFNSYKVVPTASENRPKTVGLYMCRKT